MKMHGLTLAIERNVSAALEEDVSTGDLTAGLIPAAEIVGTTAHASAHAEDNAMRAKLAEHSEPAPAREEDKTYDADSVFAKLKGLKTDNE